jgi:4'-phosphopantetheinyl transferase
MKKMNPKIYYACFADRLPAADFQSLLHSMPASMQPKALSYRRWEDAHAYVLGRKLLEYVLNISNSGYHLSDISYNAFGRPVIKGFDDFNISHSGEIVVCAVSDHGSIGIDIEKRHPLDFADFVRQFADTEWNCINQAAAPLEVFYDHWTAKEAVLKADGRGLVDNLAAIDVSSFSKVLMENKAWYLHRVSDFENYTCHLACSEPDIDYSVTDMTGWFYKS